MSCAVLGWSCTSEKQRLSQEGPGDPLAAIFTLVNSINLMIGCMLPSSVHNLHGMPSFNEVIINQKKNMKTSFFSVQF